MLKCVSHECLFQFFFASFIPLLSFYTFHTFVISMMYLLLKYSTQWLKLCKRNFATVYVCMHVCLHVYVRYLFFLSIAGAVDTRLEEEDYALIRENLGIDVPRVCF